MYTIGEISKIVNISANTLRYYDEIGLLKPSLIKDNNQYRYYSDAQIKDIVFIIELKQYGFTLDEIKKLIQNRNNQTIKRMLEEKRYKLFNEIARLKDMSIQLEKRISEINEEDNFKMKDAKILIVDDFKLARVMIKNIIEEYGYTVIGEAANGQEAISAYEEFKPDVVIMDISMPIMDGIDATTKIIEKHKNARIIICSAISCTSAVLQSIKAGAKDFVSKPISSFRLINALTRSFDDNHKFDLKHIDYISKVITNNYSKVAVNKILSQEEIDTFLYKIIMENQQDDFIRNFFKQVTNNYTDENKFLISKSTNIEENFITYLNDKFMMLSKDLSSYLSDYFNRNCLINLLAVENITIKEFKTLINIDNSIGIINYETPYSPVYINLHSEIENEQELIKEIIDFTSKNLSLFLPNYNTIDLISISDTSKSFNEDFATILVSFSLELAGENKGFISISIPHNLLHSLDI